MADDAKLDLFKQHAAEYRATARPRLVEVGPAVHLAVAGRGAPGGDAFQTAVGALYGMAFTVKMTRKQDGRGDHVVGKLEGFYDLAALPDDRDQWRWELAIRTPDVVTDTDLDDARAKLVARGKGDGVDRVRRLALIEGRCVQMLHVGPYQDEAASVAVMRAFAREQGLTPRGRHHEIYLSDPRRVPPERLRTILRQPVG